MPACHSALVVNSVGRVEDPVDVVEPFGDRERAVHDRPQVDPVAGALLGDGELDEHGVLVLAASRRHRLQ